MPAQPLRRRIQGLFWELSPPLRQWLRRLKTEASVARHRLRGAAGPRVVPRRANGPVRVFRHPAVALVDVAAGAAAVDPIGASATLEGGDRAETAYLAHGRGLERLPSAHLEAMLMAAAAEDLDWVAAGWAAPAHGPFGPSGVIGRDPGVPAATHLLLRRPDVAHRDRRPVVGRAVPHITAAERCDGLDDLEDHPAVGPYRLRPTAVRRRVIDQPWRPVDDALADLPAVDGKPTVLFLAPFLAVGGAERLLFDLMSGFRDRFRMLVVTTDPHLESLGQTVDRARELTPHVYTLGDWLPRPAVASALRHLIRRWRVESLVSWNGTVLFYDEAPALRRTFPGLRLVNQLYNHTGGWIEHFSPSLVRAVDAQIAVNTPIARALVAERGVPAERVATIHHAVGVPGPRDEARRVDLRRSLGVADETVVIGSFIRLHPQKRPLDIIRLARRMTADPVHFLLVGGGPLDAEIEREIERDPPPNLTRRPMEADATPLYDALDLCLMTSDFEGLPIFLLDGLARGIPCVATAVGDIPLLLADGGGRVIDRPGDLDAFAAAVRSLLDNELREAEGEKGRASVASRFGLDRYVAEYETTIFPGRGEHENS